MPDPSGISHRKDDHIALCVDGDVGFVAKTTLLEEVELVHDALPDLHLDEIDLSTELFGKRLSAPLVIAAMTGGTPRAEAINRDLARAAQELGVGFAFGSQRPLLTRGIRDGYFVRDVAPDALVLGNLGVVQAGQVPVARVRELCVETGVDALCIHLNPAMEVVQPEGDRDFRGGLDTIARLVNELGIPIVVKETGCGLSRSVGERLRARGVRWVDTSGSGGTSWVAVETHRAADEQKALGQRFRDWGIPTAASVAQLSGLGLGVLATGGIGSGLDAARAIALGAHAVGIARVLLQAQVRGYDVLLATLARTIAELRISCLLTGSPTPTSLQGAAIVLGPRLRRWVPRACPLRERLFD